jgi:predicted signal transduction protein with EAL and GGDEF domain
MVVLLPNANLGMAAAFADAVRLQISHNEFVVNNEAVKLTASFGVAAGPQGVDGNRLVDMANLAKNHAKNAGKNCVVVVVGERCEVWKDALLDGSSSSSGRLITESPTLDPLGS